MKWNNKTLQDKDCRKNDVKILISGRGLPETAWDHARLYSQMKFSITPYLCHITVPNIWTNNYPLKAGKKAWSISFPTLQLLDNMGLSCIPLIPAPFKIVARSTQRRVKVRAIGAAAHGSRPDEEFQTEICQPTYLILLGASQYRKPKGIHYL